MVLKFFFGDSLEEKYTKYIEGYYISYKLQYYPNCYINWINNGVDLIEYLQNKKITIKDEKNTILFYGEIIDLWESPYYIQTFYKPIHESLQGVYNFLDEETFNIHKYHSDHLVNSNFNGNFLFHEKIYFQKNYVINNTININKDKFLYFSLKEKCQYNLNLLTYTSYKGILPLMIDSQNYNSKNIYVDENFNLEKKVNKHRRENNSGEMLLWFFELEKTGEKLQGLDEYNLSLKYINMIETTIEEQLVISINKKNINKSREIILTKKLPSIDFDLSPLLPENQCIFQYSSIEKENITAFINNYLNREKFSKEFHIILNYSYYKLKCGDKIAFQWKDNQYVGIIESIELKSLDNFPNLTFAIINGSCFINEDTSSLEDEEENKFIIQKINYPTFCEIPIENINEKWRKNFDIDITNTKLTITVPKIISLRKKIIQDPITILTE